MNYGTSSEQAKYRMAWMFCAKSATTSGGSSNCMITSLPMELSKLSTNTNNYQLLDVTVGSKKIYNGKEIRLGDNLVGIDVRSGDFTIKKEKYGHWADLVMIIKPTVKADLQHLPFKDNVFRMIIFDPPHLTSKSESSIMYRTYGGWTKSERLHILPKANNEFKRVLKEGGFLILKILFPQLTQYECLLDNFVFFLPIQTLRRRGCIKPKNTGALWIIGQLKGVDLN